MHPPLEVDQFVVVSALKQMNLLLEQSWLNKLFVDAMDVGGACGVAMFTLKLP